MIEFKTEETKKLFEDAHTRDEQETRENTRRIYEEGLAEINRLERERQLALRKSNRLHRNIKLAQLGLSPVPFEVMEDRDNIVRQKRMKK